MSDSDIPKAGSGCAAASCSLLSMKVYATTHLAAESHDTPSSGYDRYPRKIKQLDELPSPSAIALCVYLLCPEYLNQKAAAFREERLHDLSRRWQEAGCPDPKLPRGQNIFQELRKYLDRLEHLQVLAGGIHHSLDEDRGDGVSIVANVV